jgi:hypothetical protein
MEEHRNAFQMQAMLSLEINGSERRFFELGQSLCICSSVYLLLSSSCTVDTTDRQTAVVAQCSAAKNNNKTRIIEFS